MGRIIDITGQRFGKLTVVKLVGTDKRGATEEAINGKRNKP